MGGPLALDFQAWENHARWWESECTRLREVFSVDDATIAQAATTFGRLGSSTVGTAYAEALREHQAVTERLGTRAEAVAGHIRRDLQSYADTERDNQQALT